MKWILSAAILCLTIATPAQATGGFVCRTGGPRPIQVSVGFGHVPGSPLILTRLIDNGQLPVKSAQWWFDQDEMRLLLIDPGAHREQLGPKARRNGSVS